MDLEKLHIKLNIGKYLKAKLLGWPCSAKGWTSRGMYKSKIYTKSGRAIDSGNGGWMSDIGCKSGVDVE